MGLHTLKDLYVKQLGDLYNAERQVLAALPQISKRAASPELRDALDQYTQQTESCLERLAKISQKVQKNRLDKKCAGIEGLLQECEEIANEEISTMISDWALIENAKKINHYEISAYRTVRIYAHLLGDEEAVKLFTRIVDGKLWLEEKLAQIADNQAKWLGHIYWAPWRSGWGVFIGRTAG